MDPMGYSNQSPNLYQKRHASSIPETRTSPLSKATVTEISSELRGVVSWQLSLQSNDGYLPWLNFFSEFLNWQKMSKPMKQWPRKGFWWICVRNMCLRKKPILKNLKNVRNFLWVNSWKSPLNMFFLNLCWAFCPALPSFPLVGLQSKC